MWAQERNRWSGLATCLRQGIASLPGSLHRHTGFIWWMWGILTGMVFRKPVRARFCQSLVFSRGEPAHSAKPYSPETAGNGIMTTRVKICGLTRPEDVEAAIRAGADAIGLVFFDKSPRAVSAEQAKQLAARIPAFVTLTGLFVNPEPAFVKQVLEQVPLDLLQFHGDETPEFCASFGRRWIKAIRVQEAGQIEQAFVDYQNACGLLVDAWDPDRYGGTGHSFNWQLIPEQRPLPLILAGGLSSASVASAIEQVRPWAVDVSGGVEQSKGRKDATKLSEFIKEVHRVCKTD